MPHSVVFPGVDVDRCRSGVAARGRAALGISEEATLISMFARFDPTKGQTGFVRCLAGVKERYPDVYGVICGLREEHRPYWGQVQDLARDLGVADRLLTPGHVAPPLKDDIVAASDVVVHPSPAESFGLAVLEAMAAGKAVVAFDSDGPRLLIDSGVDGVLVPTGDAGAMTAVVLELLADPKRRADIGGRATTASAHYSVDQMIAKLEGVWNEVDAATRPTALLTRSGLVIGSQLAFPAAPPSAGSRCWRFGTAPVVSARR